MSLEPGQTIDGKYKVGRLIGEGGMGTVYEGENSRIGRRVAIKVLHANVASMPEFAERFEREARVAARVGSPNVCDVLDLGDLPNGDRYIVMEFLDGQSLEERLVEKVRLTPHELAPIAFELLEGLGTMHNARVVHRDLKPANVFLARGPAGRGETVKILDFGVAKLLPFEGEVGTMTKTGSMMGTPLYMSPEQARGARDVDGRTDLYAASVMFYRALSGELPYMADTLNELLFKIVLEDPKPLVEVVPGIDEAFAAIVHKGLARDPEQRFSSAREYQESLAVWGKAQGRTSLQFALTLPSDPPPYLSSSKAGATKTDSKPKPAPTPAATNTTTAPGTPIAWEGNGRDDSARAPMASSPDGGAPKGADGVKVISQPGVDVSPIASTVVSASTPSPQSAQATTAPSSEQLAREAEQKRAASKSRAIMAAVAVVALCVGVGVVVAKNGGTDAKSGSAPAAEGPKDPPPPATAAPTVTAAATGATPTAEPTENVPSTTASAGPAPPTPPTARPVMHTTTNRTPDPKASSTAAATAATPPVTASATASPASSAKPASSARKFRTNID
ncbi:MAG: serine/threonine protein kinase [Deltaproteobacteria bacterium]|nr:serine/threonine protein kinase [Deltaproteobacteria bacterium]